MLNLTTASIIQFLMIFLLFIVYDAFIFDNFIITSNQSINQSIPFIFDRTGWWSLTPMTTTWVASESWRSRRTPRTSSPRDMTACSVVIHGSKLSVFLTVTECSQEYFSLPSFFLFCFGQCLYLLIDNVLTKMNIFGICLIHFCCLIFVYCV